GSGGCKAAPRPASVPSAREFVAGRSWQSFQRARPRFYRVRQGIRNDAPSYPPPEKKKGGLVPPFDLLRVRLLDAQPVFSLGCLPRQAQFQQPIGIARLRTRLIELMAQTEGARHLAVVALAMQ